MNKVTLKTYLHKQQNKTEMTDLLKRLYLKITNQSKLTLNCTVPSEDINI